MQFDFEQIDRIVNARSLAIVGASSKPMKFGSMFTSSQLRMGFDGPVYLVNPSENEILGQEVYPDIAALPETPELVYIAIPAHRSMEVLEQCAERGVKGVVIIAAGFREIGERGAALERRALDLARRSGFRIVGPNCFGIYNPRNGLTLLPGYDFSRETGDIAFISQSGGFSAHVARMGRSLGLRFSAVISYGNGSDLDETDFLRYFARDENTGCICAYLEGTDDGRGFVSALREAAEAKPVVVWKVGASEPSVRAVSSHTGSLAGSSEVWDGLFRQYGVMTASGVEELCDTLVALEKIGRRPGKRILVSGGGGGLGTFGADCAAEYGLEVPPLSRERLDVLSEVLASAGAVASNPLDIGSPLVPLEIFRGAMTEAAANPTTDVMVFDLALNFAYDLAGESGLEMAADILIEAKKSSGKPLAVVLYPRSFDPGEMEMERILRDVRARLLEGGVAVFPSMKRAMGALARIND